MVGIIIMILISNIIIIANINGVNNQTYVLIIK